MRNLAVLSTAALTLLAGMTLAHSQATNMSPWSGTAAEYYGNGSDVPGYRAMGRRWSEPGYYYAPRGAYRGYYGPAYGYYGPGRTEGIPPALYHAGDPQFWR